jgi:L-threonylcarbamoyladenylate synthase
VRFNKEEIMRMIRNDIAKAVEILQQGGLVAIPTETVYGLAADARNPDALRKIFIAKQRPIDHPLIVHLADISELPKWARDVSDSALALAHVFWPGPLTLILKKAPDVNELVTGGQDTIGLRIPNHPVALDLLKNFGSGVAAPSANRFGRISPTTANAVREELGAAVDLVLEGGQCQVGVESTIVDVSGDSPVILRPGMINSVEIAAVLQKPIGSKANNAPRVSGSLESHYAPSTKTVLLRAEQVDALLAKDVEKPLAIVSLRDIAVEIPGIFTTKMPQNAADYAHDLYYVLRELDKKQFKQIIIETIPEFSEWDAIRDRLQRATSGSD